MQWESQPTRNRRTLSGIFNEKPKNINAVITLITQTEKFEKL